VDHDVFQYEKFEARILIEMISEAWETVGEIVYVNGVLPFQRVKG